MRRPQHHELIPLDIDIMRALKRRHNQWPNNARLAADLDLDPTSSRDRTRVLASLYSLRRRRYVAVRRYQLDQPAQWALTTTGYAKLAELDQLTIA